MESECSNNARNEGYDFAFVSPLDPSYECSICLLCQRDPVQTRCGHRFCKQCIEQWLSKEGMICPKDNTALTDRDIFPDNHAKREIMQLNIKCPNYGSGCDKILNISTLQDHLQECAHTEKSCPHACNVMVKKESLGEHIKYNCENRPVQCSQCQQLQPFKNILNHKKVECPHGVCTCLYCSKELERYQMPRHVEKECPNVHVSCCFSAFGCDKQMKRSELLEHIEQSKDLHNQIVCEMVHKFVMKGMGGSHPVNMANISHDSENLSFEPTLMSEKRSQFVFDDLASASSPRLNHASSSPRLNFANLTSPRLNHVQRYADPRENHIEELFTRVVTLEQQNHHMDMELKDLRQKINDKEQELEGRFCFGSFKWKIENFTFLKNEALSGNPKTIHSPSFYTNPCGYKVSIRVNFQITEMKQGDAVVSMYVHFMRGEYDDDLVWPFQGFITMSIIHPVEQNVSIFETMSADPDKAAFQRIKAEQVGDRNKKGFGFREFTAASELEQGNYIQDDNFTVKIAINQIKQ